MESVTAEPVNDKEHQLPFKTADSRKETEFEDFTVKQDDKFIDI